MASLRATGALGRTGGGAAATKLHPDGWRQSNQRVVNTAHTYRAQSQAVRAQAHELSRATTSHLQRTQREVQNNLSLRLDDIGTRKADLEREIDVTFGEIGRMLTCKDGLEEELRAKSLPLEITRECMALREGRLGVDVVEDGVETALTEEEALIEGVKEQLQHKIDECSEQIRLLRSCHFQLEEDLRDKFNALEIDRQCAELEETSRNLDFYQDSVKIDSRAVHPEDWHGYTSDNTDRANQEQANAARLREEVDALLKGTADSLTQMSNRCEDAFNGRIAEYQAARNDITQALTKVRTETQEQDLTIADLEAAIEARQGPLKVAQTRLQKRSLRPNVELVKDPAQYSLVKEVEAIEDAIETLRAQLTVADNTARALRRTELQLDEDLQVKTNSLNIENKCMQRRQQFKYRTV